MNVEELTAPCGLYCAVCSSYKEGICRSCRVEGGKCIVTTWQDNQGECRLYVCAAKRGIHNCSECTEFPCGELQPYLDMADRVYHNQKVYNLCLIKKLGLQKWANEKAQEVHDQYFTGKWKI